MLRLDGKKNNIMYFANDDSFYDFCINPVMRVCKVISTNGDEILYPDYDFTQAYLDAVAAGVRFCIKDELSRVNKNGLLPVGTSTKRIDNIERYYGE